MRDIYDQLKRADALISVAERAAGKHVWDNNGVTVDREGYSASQHWICRVCGRNTSSSAGAPVSAFDAADLCPGVGSWLKELAERWKAHVGQVALEHGITPEAAVIIHKKLESFT